MSVPRYTGVRTFAGLPHTRELEGVDVAVVGVPFDTATSYRPGARFGPEAIRAGSTLLRPYHPAVAVDVFGSLNIVDYGDVVVTPGNAERTAGQIAEGLAPVLAAGAVSLVLGGDHSVVLGELRAHATVAGEPVGVVLLDAHADTWDEYFGQKHFHGTTFRRAVEEGLVDAPASVQAGMRGSLYAAGDLELSRELGFRTIPADELRALGPDGLALEVGSRVGDRPVFLSFDVDFLDPAFAPGTGTPEIAGFTTADAVAFLRALRGLRLAAADVVEVSPSYDGPGQITALAAANVAWELLALRAAAAAD